MTDSLVCVCSCHCRYLVSYRPPRRVIDEYGYSVEFVDKIMTSMTGSGEGHTAYFYRRLDRSLPRRVKGAPPPQVAQGHMCAITLPARSGFDQRGETEEVIYCDNTFRDCVLLSISDLDSYRRDVKVSAEAMLTAGRPKRERKPRTL